MIGKLKKGASFGGCVRYVTGKDEAKIGRLWKFKVSEVDAWMKSGVAADK